jgi:deazaflavin-dependent oxidoreductase (nitroreductase family)
MPNWLWFTRAHCSVYRGTRGLVGGKLLGIQMLLLTTKGRKTGLPRTLPLAYVEHDDQFIIVASNGGSEKPPAWWLNLQSSPTAYLQVGGDQFEVSWELAPAERRMELWRRLQAAIPAYRAYRVRTEREIPIVLLKRVETVWETRPLAASSVENHDGSETSGPEPDAEREGRDRS